MRDSEPKSDILPQRLCSEIQLFELCDLDTCSIRNGRFCPDSALLDRFERIAEEELRISERYVSDEVDGAEADDSDGYDEAFEMDDLENDKDEGWDDEE